MAAHIDAAMFRWLALLCRHHHRLVHEGGFGLNRTQAGELVFTDPAGKGIPDAAERRFRGNFFDLLAGNENAGIKITAETPIPDWLGDSMDDDIVVHLLMLRD